MISVIILYLTLDQWNSKAVHVILVLAKQLLLELKLLLVRLPVTRLILSFRVQELKLLFVRLPVTKLILSFRVEELRLVTPFTPNYFLQETAIKIVVRWIEVTEFISVLHTDANCLLSLQRGMTCVAAVVDAVLHEERN